MTLWLYDIDGTILSTGGAGRSALNEAFEALYGVPPAFARVSFAGRTDPGIIADAFQLAEMEPRPHGELIEAYLPRLERRLGQGTTVVHPGVHAALDATHPMGVNALLTGNMEAGAQRKLADVGLWDRFALGAYGDDSPFRNDLVPVAETRARQAGRQFSRTVVIGDTPADVACARAGGAIAVAVLTGWSSREALEASEPDLLLEDLESGLDALLGL